MTLSYYKLWGRCRRIGNVHKELYCVIVNCVILIAQVFLVDRQALTWPLKIAVEKARISLLKTRGIQDSSLLCLVAVELLLPLFIEEQGETAACRNRRLGVTS